MVYNFYFLVLYKILVDIDTLKLNFSYCQVNSDYCSIYDSIQMTNLHFNSISFLPS